MNLCGGCRKKQKGAITVFLAIIFMSLIVFAGVMIDIARIAAAERRVQGALNSSARSVLAGYDGELTGGYGIYGVNVTADNVKDNLYRYLSINLKERHRGINFINIMVYREDIGVQGFESLLEGEAFKKQIQEYMKYRTPINVMENLIEQLKNIKLDKKVSFAEGEKTTRGKAKELRAKANSVNAKLGGIKNKIVNLSAEKLEEVKNDLSEALTISNSISDVNGEGLLEQYNRSREETNNKAKEAQCIENQSQEFVNIKDNCRTLAPELKKCLEETNNTLLIIKPMKYELKALNKELSELKDRLRRLEKKLSKIEEGDDSSCDEGDGIREEIDEIECEIDEVEEEIGQLENRIESEISKLKMKYETFCLDGYSLKGEAEPQKEKRMEELKEKISQIKGDISKSLLRRIEKEWLITEEEFDGGNAIIVENIGVMDEEAPYNSSMKEEDAEKSNDIVLKNIKKLVEIIEDAGTGAAEKINTIEYVMDKFTFLTSKTERGHFFKKGEVEYIISGSDTAGTYTKLNNTEYYVVTNVLLQVWALRFAIDTIDSFIHSIIVFPPQRLAFALIEGALDSCLDMINMLSGQGVSICPKSLAAIKLKYSDHLKILLMMKPEEEILRKARQLMQVNIKQAIDADTGLARSDFRLSDYSTVALVTLKARVNLFFLPLLKIDRLMPGDFEMGRYIIQKQIYVGY